jgi:sialate O-acetylesterase
MRLDPRYLFVLPLLAVLLRADVSLPRVLGDNMVLQREQPVPVWGRAAPGEAVVVRFAGQEKRAQADAAGRWQVTLDPLAPSATPATLTVAGAGAHTIELKNVLVGEVWLCSGQSNMDHPVNDAREWAPPVAVTDATLGEEIKTKDFPLIRLFRAEKKLAPPEVVSDGWHEAAGVARDKFSAIGYLFGRQLFDQLGVPIGLVQATWGGSRIEEWTPTAAYARLEAVLGPAGAPSFERDARLIGRNYEGMVRPLVPFALRGVIWYQGESNLIAYHDGLRYADKMRVWIESWRAAWNRPDLPIYWVQIAPYLYSSRKDPLLHAADELPKIWEAQAAALAIPHTGMVPTTDVVDDLANIHPPRKRPIAERLASLALIQTYGHAGLTWFGPVFERLELEGACAIVRFSHPDGLLDTRDGKLATEFEIAGADGNFMTAQAEITGEFTVRVWSAAVPHPATVRFAWRETARPNLINGAGLPAYPFRTNAPVWTGAHPATPAKTPLVP